MLRTFLHGKIHKARVTHQLVNYEGSLGIDESLMDLAGILPGERVDIYDITNGERLSTYVIPEEKGSGKIKILFVMHDFHGWDMGAVWEDIKFATKHCRDIEKIAMVGESKWEKWMATICKPFTLSSIKYFEAGQVAEARQWLMSA